ncbi:hypothetical protein [Sphingobacterium sp.]|uniref:hypothetical protein n=1 Tax=Sphingobacterium sp. TaxID=341027 RepID=UPI00289C6893|nr:hypothetical protein [Sphingobacterium sp.]
MKGRIYNLKAKNSQRVTQNMVEKMEEVVNDIDLTNFSLSNESSGDRNSISEFSINIDSAASLLNTYFKVKDHWGGSGLITLNNLLKSNQTKSNVLLNAYMKSLFQIFLHDEEMQGIIMSTLQENNPDLDDLAIRVEKRWNLFFPFSQVINDENLRLRTLISILLSGLHFYLLQSKSESSIFYNMDFNSKECIEQIEKSIWNILDWTFQ